LLAPRPTPRLDDHPLSGVRDCLFNIFAVYKVLVGKSEGKRPLDRPRRRWEDGIRMDRRETGLGGVDWIRLAQDRDRWRAVMSAVMNLRVLAPRS
jgi:hypothetical protein